MPLFASANLERENMTQAIDVPRNNVTQLQRFLKEKTAKLSEWAAERVDPVSLIRFACLEFSQSPQLQQCTHESIYLALIACAQLGLEPGGVKQEAFIVPYKQTATFQLGHRGIIKLALQSGEVQRICSNVVYERDKFDIDIGSDARVIHKPALSKRGTLIGSYALAKMTNGELDVEWMSMEDLTAIRRQATYRDKESPAWANWATEMYRKAPIKRLGKRLPLSTKYAMAASLDESSENGDLQSYNNIIDAAYDPETGEVK